MSLIKLYRRREIKSRCIHEILSLRRKSRTLTVTIHPRDRRVNNIATHESLHHAEERTPSTPPPAAWREHPKVAEGMETPVPFRRLEISAPGRSWPALIAIRGDRTALQSSHSPSFSSPLLLIPFFFFSLDSPSPFSSLLLLILLLFIPLCFSFPLFFLFSVLRSLRLVALIRITGVSSNSPRCMGVSKAYGRLVGRN